ncbi:MAG TPA: heparinase II/III family protein [Natronosporangium sp.]
MDSALVRLPADRGGWWHEYVCPSHGVELEHVDLFTGRFPAGGAPCRYGCRIDTPAVRGAWTVLAHQACARAIQDLAARQPERAVALLREYDQRYAELAVDDHPAAQPWMLAGRLFQQALTEAIWAVRIGLAARALGDPVPRLTGALAEAARQARDKLVAQGRFTSNYTAWLNAAGAVCAPDPSWLTGPHGVYAHLAEAVGGDGWEWEASTYYHAFVLRAYLVAIDATPDHQPPAEVVDRLSAMAAALDAVTTSGGLIPALHDTPYARPATEQEYAELAELRGRLLPAPAEPTRPVTVFPDAGYAVLRTPGIHAIVDFGPHGGSHGHRDKLALYLYGTTTPWQPDPGQLPYGHRHWRDYYASTAAHPTFSVDSAEQAECAGRLVVADDTGVTVECDSAYPGVTARRTLTLDGDGLRDELTVICDRPRRVTLQFRPDVPVEVAPATTRWLGIERLRGHHECTDPAAVLLARPGPGQADDPQRARTHLDWVVPATREVTFRSTYRPHPV